MSRSQAHNHHAREAAEFIMSNEPNTMRVDTVKQNALRIFEAASSRDVGAASLLRAIETAKQEGIPAAQAHRIVIEAWKEEGRRRIRDWDVRSLGALIDLFPDCVPSRYRLLAFTADADHEDAQWRVRFLPGQPRPVDQGVASPNLDLYLQARGVDKSKGLHSRIYDNIQRAIAQIKARKAAELPPLPTFECTTQSTTEHLLATWLDTEPSPDVKADWRGPYWATATVDGTTLYTRPCKVMDRPYPYAPYAETDGVLFQFVREGRRLQNWRPASNAQDAQVMQSSFDYFAKKYAVHISPLGWNHISHENDAADTPKQNPPERPRP